MKTQDTASLFNLWHFHFAGAILSRGKEAPLTEFDVDALPKTVNINHAYDRLANAWSQEQRDQAQPSILRAFYYANRKTIWKTCTWSLLESCTRIGQPVTLGYLLRWFNSDPLAAEDGSGMREGWIVCAVMVGLSYLQVKKDSPYVPSVPLIALYKRIHSAFLSSYFSLE